MIMFLILLCFEIGCFLKVLHVFLLDDHIYVTHIHVIDSLADSHSSNYLPVNHNNVWVNANGML